MREGRRMDVQGWNVIECQSNFSRPSIDAVRLESMLWGEAFLVFVSMGPSRISPTSTSFVSNQLCNRHFAFVQRFEYLVRITHIATLATAFASSVGRRL